MIDAQAWQRIGPFDEGYQLYFEETDWLHRARRASISSCYVPGAHVEHLYAQSTQSEPQAEAWFEASHDRFRRRHYGNLFTSALGVADRSLGRLGVRGRSEIEELPPVPVIDDDTVRWIEISASALGFPAAARRVEGLVLRAGEPFLSQQLLEQAGGSALRVAAINESGEELYSWSVAQ